MGRRAGGAAGRGWAVDVGGPRTHRDLQSDDRRHQDGEGAARVARVRRLVDGVAAHGDARDEQDEEESGVAADDD